MTGKDRGYTKNISEVHENFKNWLYEYYGLETILLGDKPSSWGFGTSCYYLKSKNGEYAIRVSKYTPRKAYLVKKDIFISNYLKQTIPTPTYLKTKRSKNFILKDRHIIKLTQYIHGIPPFDMNLTILKEAATLLKKMHSHQPPDIRLSTPKELKKYDNKKFLHGDLTPSNMLVANDKIIGILDFEHSIFGPVEWDLAKCAVFSWFRMYENTGFEEVMKVAVEAYDSDTLNTKLLLKFSYKNARDYLRNIIKNKGKYENKDWWTTEYKFAKKMADHLKHLVKKSNRHLIH